MVAVSVLGLAGCGDGRDCQPKAEILEGEVELALARPEHYRIIAGQAVRDALESGCSADEVRAVVEDEMIAETREDMLAELARH